MTRISHARRLTLWAIAVLCLFSLTVTATEYDAEVLNPDLNHATHNAKSGTELIVGSDATVWRRGARQNRFRSTGAGQRARTLATLNRVMFDSDASVAVAVGEEGTVLRSGDDGVSWIGVGSGAVGSMRDVLSLGEQGIWLVAGDQGRVLRSTDGARHWNVQNVGSEVQINRLFAAADDRIWAVGEASMIAVADKRGEHWQLRRVKQGREPVVTLAEAGGVMLAGSGNGLVLRSVDGGNTWAEIQTPSRAFILKMMFLPRHGTWVAITHEGESLWSNDDGQHWHRVGSALGTSLTDVAYSPDRNLLVSVGHAGVIQISSDGGRNWQRRTLDPELHLLGLAMRAGRWLAWGRDGVLLQMGDPAGEWKVLRPPLLGDTTTLARSPGNSSVIAAGTAGWMARSRDGEHWQPVPMKFVVDSYPTDFRVVRATVDGRALLAAGPTATIMRSDDDGRHWRTVMHRPFETAETPVDLVATRSGAWLAPEMSGPIDRSLDQGLTWQRLAKPAGWLEGNIIRAGLASPSDGTVLLVGKGTQLLRSEDHGASWIPTLLPGNHNLFALWAEPSRRSWWLAGAEGALLRSDDGGRSWRHLQIKSAEAVRSVLLNLSRTVSGRWVVAGRDGVIAVSDEGEHWRRISSGTVQDLRIALKEPDSDLLVLVGRGGTVLRCTDVSCGKWESLYSHTRADFRAAIFLHDGSLIAAGARIVRLRPQSSMRHNQTVTP
jgi:photosystem II stability/assembly factor-like uncharacterized protein